MTMPGAPSDWCPDWYPLLEAANYLHTQPWTLLGLDYTGRSVPSYWRWIAWDLIRSKANAAVRRQRSRVWSRG